MKGYFNDIGRAARFIGEPEAYFYRDLAAATGVRTLRPVYADVDPTTRHGVVITDDVAAEGAEFLDGRSPLHARPDRPEPRANSLGCTRQRGATAQWSTAHGWRRGWAGVRIVGHGQDDRRSSRAT